MKSFRSLFSLTAAIVLFFVLSPVAAFATGHWVYTGSMTFVHSGVLAPLQNGKAIVIAGTSGQNATGYDSEMYDEAIGAWSRISDDGRVFAMASYGSSPALYNPATNLWSGAGFPFTRNHVYANLVKLSDGRLLLIGGASGIDDNGQGCAVLCPIKETDLYDPSTDQWTQTGSTNDFRGAGGMGENGVLLNDGRVLVAGGQGYGTNSDYKVTTELYDPATGTWSYTGSLHKPRWFAQMVKLHDGRVLIAGGGLNDQTESEIYDPATGQWTVTGPLHDGLSGPVIELQDGRVLFPAAPPTPSEIYDPSTGTWTVDATMNDGWSGYFVLLPSGNVLTAGGYGANGVVNTAQLYCPTNCPPQISTLSSQTVNEGGTYSATGSFTDSDSTSWTGTVDYGDGTGEHAFASPNESIDQVNHTFTVSYVYKDNKANDAPYTVTVKIIDNQGATSIPKTAQVTVHNVAPTPGAITAPPNPVQINTAITASANFTDPGVLDTHTASWNWGDGTTPGTVTESKGSGSVSDSHTYTVPGVYQITLTVTDKDGGTGTSVYQYESVYDPTPQGLFTGARTFNSPAGAYTQNTSLTGQVQFGIVAKYSGSAPSGNVTMNFQAANLKFVATSISTLVIANGKATLQGSGTINGQDSYTFSAVGMQNTQNGGQDFIRFQIKDSNGNVVYDTQPGAALTADPTTSVTG